MVCNRSKRSFSASSLRVAGEFLRCLQFFPRAFTIRSRLFRKWLLYYSHQEKKEVLHMKSLKKWALAIALALVVTSVGGYAVSYTHLTLPTN